MTIVRFGPGQQPASIAPPPCANPDPDQWVERRQQGILMDGGPSHERIIRSYRNGCYQHLLFLGISGFAICNHVDREILLVDPWPTYHSYWTRVNSLQFLADSDETRRPLRDQDSTAKNRIASLASFLRNAVEMGYELTGVLISHLHFDHAEDVVLLLELMAADTVAHIGAGSSRRGTYVDHMGRSFGLSGPRVDPERLPKICCDYDTMIYLLTYRFYVDHRRIEIDGNEQFRPPHRIRERPRYWYGNEALLEILDERIEESGEDENHFVNVTTQAWQRVKDRYVFTPSPGSTNIVDNDAWLEISVGGQRLHYDDSYNAYLDTPEDRCDAGVACTEFDLGNFNISPYVWDHMNTGAGSERQEALDEQSAGRLQRMSAFLVKHNGAQDAKRTFIVGSSGEMHLDWTDAMSNIDPIETDLLIYAITRPEVPLFWGIMLDFRDQIDPYIRSLVRSFIPHEALILCHFEEFVKEVASREQYIECFDNAVGYNLNVLREKAMLAGATEIENLFEYNRIHVLARHGTGFEVPMPTDPISFKREAESDPLPLRQR